ncbi:MAG: class I SAM-dependent methyltransferase [Gammaproteobacteria bacterium]|nr:MAG: class I SAM-dependent methyltransferase [Gammaproteobacteria bacterium]
MTDFSIAWLDLREPADLKARDKTLATRALQWLQKNFPNQGHMIVDLGSGTGSSLRALAGLGAADIVWRLVDNNGDLLDEALRRHRKDWIIEDYEADLNVVNELPLGGAQLITASALLDLASREFVDELKNRITRQRSALYAVLNYDGTTEWAPAHPGDEKVLAAFNLDQARDKGFGPALGPQATDYLTKNFQAENYEIFTAGSSWCLTGKDHLLVSELIHGIANAVKEHIDSAELDTWKQFRLTHVQQGSCRIGHLDFLALPAKR